MTISLMALPYPLMALEPLISAATLEIHHGKHHQAYVTKTNALAAERDLGAWDLETIIRSAASNQDKALFNQAAQVWNHGFYWLSLSPDQSAPSGDLETRIKQAFGSKDALVTQLAEAAVRHFASGWAWLVAGTDGSLSIETTHDSGTPLVEQGIPLLTIDVWEHAYYLDRKNDRKAYVEAVLDRTINWDFAAANLARGEVWTYPR